MSDGAVTRTAFAPACVGNVGVGFDILGHSIHGAGDSVAATRSADGHVTITSIDGLSAGVPMASADNTASVAVQALCTALALPFGFSLALHKGISLGSGMGGSAASCVAALVAANALLDEPLPRADLYSFALRGESIASGGSNGDNVGPMLIGGLVLALPERLVRIPVPAQWHCLLVHPDVVLETLKARHCLQQRNFGLDQFVAQSANLSALLAGCFSGDASLIRHGLNDVLVEPRREELIVGFAEVKRAALEAGAMGCSISGAGPSVFAWFESEAGAEQARLPMQQAFAQSGFSSQAYVSPVAGPAAYLLS